MTDQVEARALQIRQHGRLPFHFLDVVFTEFAQPHRIGFADHVGRENFGNGQQANSRRIPVGLRAGLLDSFSHRREAVG